MEHEEKTLMRYILLLSCIKKGYISIKKAKHTLGWTKQKVIAVARSLCEKGVLTEDRVENRFKGEYINRLVGYNLKNF